MKKIVGILVMFVIVFSSSTAQEDRSYSKAVRFYQVNELGESKVQINAQSELLDHFRSKSLSVWQSANPINSREQLVKFYEKDYSERALKKKWSDSRSMFYCENKLPYSMQELTKLYLDMDLQNYPSLMKFGISAESISIREMPTTRPKFLNFELGGEGYPFDYFQVSAIATNTPLRILHQSVDGFWLFVETPNNSWGWVKATNVAIVSNDIIKAYSDSRQYASITKDDVIVKDLNQRVITSASIGASFPIVADLKDSFKVIVATRDRDGNAFIKEAVLAKSIAVVRGLEFNDTNFQLIMRNMIGGKYGWGGDFGNRDCSQLLMDMFSVFGIWLPRDSRPQIEYLKQHYKYVQFNDGVVTDDYGRQKELKLIEEGVPYLTFLELSGHIMLYCGAKNDTAIVFHSVWGLRTNDRDCRLIIGKSCLTDLWAGKDYIGIDRNSLLIKRIKGFIILGQKK